MREIKTLHDRPDRIRLSFAGLSAKSISRDTDEILGVSVVTRGEALGHGLWLDADFIKQVVKAGNSAKSGVKARFAHPGLSGDGLGKFLGRAGNFRQEGDKAFADIAFSRSAHNTPDGDLAGYIMDLAEDDPEALGVSIVFSQDLLKQSEFTEKHTKKGRFESPDEDNVGQYPHARLSKLYAADFVDDPAANPDGLFSFMDGNEIPAAAEALLSFAFGITDQEPPAMLTGIHPQRAKAFVTDFLQRHGLAVYDLNQTNNLDAEVIRIAKNYKRAIEANREAWESLQRYMKGNTQNG